MENNSTIKAIYQKWLILEKQTHDYRTKRSNC
jgi:hypothetical protein